MHEKTNLIMVRLFCRPIFRSSGQRGSAVGEVELSHTFTGFSQWHDINLDVGNGWALRHIVLSFSAKKRQRDNAKCYNQRNATRRRDKQTGLSTVFYKYSNSVDIFLFYQCFSCSTSTKIMGSYRKSKFVLFITSMLDRDKNDFYICDLKGVKE